MSFIGKTYNHQKDERFKDFLESIGAPADRIELMLKDKPSLKIEKNGDEYVQTTVFGGKPKDMKFKSGVEFDETIVEGIVSKTTITVAGDVITQVQRFPDGRSVTIDKKFSGNGLDVSFKSSFWDGVAHRHYTA